jgi:putative transposase
VTYYVLFFIHLESRRVDIAGITVHSDEAWMRQIARNVTMKGYGTLRDCRYLLHDRDTKYTRSFRAIIVSGRVEPLVLPARRVNLSAYAERWVRSMKEECLSKVILFGERSLRRALCEYVEHYHAERNHQGKDNVLLFPRYMGLRRAGPVQCRKRLGGLLRYYPGGGVIARAQRSILNSDSAAATRRSRSRGRALRPVVPTHAPGKLAGALRPTGSFTVRIF